MYACAWFGEQAGCKYISMFRQNRLHSFRHEISIPYFMTRSECPKVDETLLEIILV